MDHRRKVRSCTFLDVGGKQVPWRLAEPGREKAGARPRTSHVLAAATAPTTAAFEVEVRLSRWCPTSASRATTVQRFRTAYHPDDTTAKPSNAAPLHTPPHASRLERLKVLTRRNGMGPASASSDDRDHRNPRWLSSGVSNVGPRMAACIPHVAMVCSKSIPPSVRYSWSTPRRRNGMGPASANSEDRDHRNPRWLSSGVSNVGPRMAACIPHVAVLCSKPIPPSVRDSWSTSRDSALSE